MRTPARGGEAPGGQQAERRIRRMASTGTLRV
jgi:hypothetical protein